MTFPILKIMNRPYNIKHRDKIILNSVKIENVSQIDSNFLVEFQILSSDTTKIYLAKILTDSDNINYNTQIKVHCNCQSFKYQYETILSQIDGLYGIPSSHKLPKKQTLHVCKHLEGAISLLLRIKKIPKFGTKGYSNDGD